MQGWSHPSLSQNHGNSGHHNQQALFKPFSLHSKPEATSSSNRLSQNLTFLITSTPSSKPTSKLVSTPKTSNPSLTSCSEKQASSPPHLHKTPPQHHFTPHYIRLFNHQHSSGLFSHPLLHTRFSTCLLHPATLNVWPTGADSSSYNCPASFFLHHQSVTMLLQRFQHQSWMWHI